MRQRLQVRDLEAGQGRKKIEEGSVERPQQRRGKKLTLRTKQKLDLRKTGLLARVFFSKRFKQGNTDAMSESSLTNF